MHPRPRLFGRAGELQTLEQLLEDARGSRSGVIVLRGEPGIGKTALLRQLVSEASGFRVVSGLGVESEMELPFAGLHQLCAPILGRLGSLAEPQRRGLSVAFGLVTGDNPDRFMVALAALSLMAEVAEERPLLCVVDDAHWSTRPRPGPRVRRAPSAGGADSAGVRGPDASRAARPPGGLARAQAGRTGRRVGWHAAGDGPVGSDRRERPDEDHRGDARQPARPARALPRAGTGRAGRRAARTGE